MIVVKIAVDRDLLSDMYGRAVWAMFKANWADAIVSIEPLEAVNMVTLALERSELDYIEREARSICGKILDWFVIDEDEAAEPFAKVPIPSAIGPVPVKAKACAISRQRLMPSL